jgi:hypothetical protein
MTLPGSYQSKFLNFVVRQSRQLRDRCALQGRQARMKTVWGLQILLFPLYRILNTTPSPTLKQAVAKGWERLRQFSGPESKHRPAADTVIQRVRSGIECFLLPPPVRPALDHPSASPPLEPDPLPVMLTQVEIQPLRRLSLWARVEQGLQRMFRFGQDPQSQSALSLRTRRELVLPIPLKIQGIATLLETRHLVLVSDHSQVLDILTPQQQTQLQRWITWELTEYYRQLRQVYRLAGRAIALTPWSISIHPQPQPRIIPTPLPSLVPQDQPQDQPQGQPRMGAIEYPLGQQIRLRILGLWQGTHLPVRLFSPPSLTLDLADSSVQEDANAHNRTIGSNPPPLPNPLVAFSGVIQPSIPSRLTVPGLENLDHRLTPAYSSTRGALVETAAIAELEVEALVVGYDMHFLEQILQWLDQLMVWVEGVADFLWQKLLSLEFIRHWQQRIKR